MDRIDFRLLAQLYKDSLQSTRGLARATSVTPRVAQARLRRMMADGVLRGFYAFLDPAIFGKREAILRFAGPHARETCVRALGERDVAVVTQKIDESVTVVAWLDDNGDVVERLTRVFAEKPSFRTERAKKTVAELSPLDWQVLRACVDAPKHTTAELVARSHLSPRTAVKRRDALIDARLLTIRPITGPMAGAGDVIYTVGVAGPIRLSAIRRVLGDCEVINAHDDPPTHYLLCLANDLTRAMTLTSQLRKQDGVSWVEISLDKETWASARTPRDAVEAKLAQWRRAEI